MDDQDKSFVDDTLNEEAEGEKEDLNALLQEWSTDFDILHGIQGNINTDTTWFSSTLRANTSSLNNTSSAWSDGLYYGWVHQEHLFHEASFLDQSNIQPDYDPAVPPRGVPAPSGAERAWNIPTAPSQQGSERLPVPVTDGVALGHFSTPLNDHQSRSPVRFRIPPAAKAIIEDWFENHRHDPYLEKVEAVNLSRTTGLTIRQIRTFLANRRARTLVFPPSALYTSASQPRSFSPTKTTSQCCSTDSLSGNGSFVPNIDAASGTAIRSSVGGRAHSVQQDPMERYLSTSPEDEGLSEFAITRAAADFAAYAGTSRSESRENSLARSAKGVSDRSSEPSISETAISGLSASSHASIDSIKGRGPRKGRKRHREHMGSGKEADAAASKALLRMRTSEDKLYQCTFCARDFGQKYDWRRHEESVHVPQRVWVCMPTGPSIEIPVSGVVSCAFCNVTWPTSVHFDEEHHTKNCMQSPEHERTFTRKDKLLQHLAQVHKQPKMSEPMLNWSRPANQNAHLRCGFCGLRLSSWSERVDHIAAHYLKGIDMTYWLGQPGGVTGSSSSPSLSTNLPSPADSLASHTGNGRSLLNVGGRLSYSSKAGGATWSPARPHTCMHILPDGRFCNTPFARFEMGVWHERAAHDVWRPRSVPRIISGQMNQFKIGESASVGQGLSEPADVPVNCTKSSEEQLAVAYPVPKSISAIPSTLDTASTWGRIPGHGFRDSPFVPPSHPMVPTSRQKPTSFSGRQRLPPRQHALGYHHHLETQNAQEKAGPFDNML